VLDLKIIIFIFAFSVLYAIIENRLLLRVRTEKFYRDNDRIKIVHLSDLHKRLFGKNNVRLIKKIRSTEPDIIIFSGDLITRDCKSLMDTEKFIQELVKIAPVYFSFGNHELDMKNLYPDKYEKFILILKNNSVHILDNQSESLVINGRKINITGLSLKYSVYKKNNSYRNLDKYSEDEIFQALGTPPDDGINILIAHNPLFAEAYSSWNADYTLSGHIHGGAVRIFGIPLLSPERKLFPRYSKGVYEKNGMKLLVSGGLGKFRLFNPPEIPVYFI